MLMLKKLLRDKRMAQKTLAMQLGIDESTMSLIANGFRPISPEHRRAIEQLFGAEEVAKYDVQPLAPMQAQATILPTDVVEDIQEEARNDLRQAIEEMAKRVDVLEEMIRQQNRMLDIMEKMVATLERR